MNDETFSLFIVFALAVAVIALVILYTDLRSRRENDEITAERRHHPAE